jgi:aryl-alcohol dehydrogenase
MPTQITAAVVREKSGPFTIETLELTDPRPDELLVKIVASGMCQTDIHGRDGYFRSSYPAVYGHEGSGIVEAVGNAVTKFAPGDHVVISYPWCGTCPNCLRQQQSHCQKNFDLKMKGTRADGSTLMKRDDGTAVYSAFFQQSSFATYAIANERFAVKVRKDAPLELLGPFACSGQTGAGAVFNSLKPLPGDALVVFGTGAVGLSALMAAKIAGCDPLIAVDVHDSRLQLARELGATHAINNRNGDAVAEIRKLTGSGVRFSIETSAMPAVFRQAVDVLMPAGTCVLLGSARAGTEATLEMPFLQFGRVVRGVIQGESKPPEFIPRLVDYLVEGKMPVERMMTFYNLADINQAAADSAKGTTIKPVLRIG